MYADKIGGVFMLEPRKKEIIEKIATMFPTLPEERKAYVAGYISAVEDVKLSKDKQFKTA